jgi:hypothetical protein
MAKLYLGKAAIKAMLNSPNLPNDEPAKARYRGRSGRPFSCFLIDLFLLNETIPLKDRKTDAALCKIICDEFVKIPELVKRLEEGEYSINYYRTYYNRGRLVKGRVPKKVSFRYGFGALQGVPVSFIYGNRELTPEEIIVHIRKFRGNNWPLLHDLPRVPKLIKLFIEEGLIPVDK